VNTHNLRPNMLAAVARSRSVASSVIVLVLGTGTWGAPGVTKSPECTARLDRLVASETLACQVRVIVDTTPPHLTFFVVPFAESDLGVGTAETGFVYGIGGDPHALPIRWTSEGGILFVGHHLNIPTFQQVDLSRFPLSELLCDAGADARPNQCPERKHGRSFKYCDITPAKKALTGFMSLTDEGFERTMPPAPHVVQYDIRAVNDTVIELFMTVDRHLAKWVYDGKQWKHLRNYPIEIKGEFLVCQDGRSLVTERDGNWSVVEFEAAEPIFKAITERVPDQPLTLVEDTVEKQTYFEHRGDVFDKAGVKVWAAPSGLKRNDRAQALVDFVRTRRSK